MNSSPRLLLLATLTAGALGAACAGGEAEPEPEIAVEGERLDAAELVVTASHGERVDLDEYLEDGVVTVVEFYADW